MSTVWPRAPVPKGEAGRSPSQDRPYRPPQFPIPLSPSGVALSLAAWPIALVVAALWWVAMRGGQ